MDPYAILGVERDADSAAIASAFRRQVRGSHPDTQRPNEDQLALAIAAYDLLRDPQRRAEYDQRTRPQRTQARNSMSGTVIPVRIHPSPKPDLRVGPPRQHPEP